MKDYVAWLNDTSVAYGTKFAVEAKAREIAATALWQEWNPVTILRITRGKQQFFVKSIILNIDHSRIQSRIA